jgi:hypothetical protein
MMGVHGKCKLENPCESFCLQKAWHAQFLRKEPRIVCAASMALTHMCVICHYKYDSRGSRLTNVFGKLLHEGRLEEEQLRGLSQHQLNAIRSYKDFLSEADATEPGT